MTPIAQREIDVVTRSQTPSQRSSSPGISTLPSARLSFPTSVSRNRQMKMIVKRRGRRKEVAGDAEHGPDRVRHRGRDLLGAGLHVLGGAAVAEPGRARPESRKLSTVCGRSWRKSRTPPTSGTRNSSATTSTATAVPSTVTVAASPRDMRVFAITKRTGYSNTSPRKMPTNTIRNVSPIAQNAASTPTARRRAAPSALAAPARRAVACRSGR